MKPSTDVWATNARGEKRRFTRMSWDLLKAGKDGSKDGWKELPDTIIHNTVEIKKPSTGNGAAKTQVIDNTLETKTTQVIGNTVDPKDDGKDKTDDVVITDDQKAEFFKAAEGLKKGDIKDFFDKQTPPVEYVNTSKDKNYFPNLLGEHLKYDVVELQKAFN